ncbi:MAG: hypothetical protein WC849_03710 [Candidatus Paceibacterota bacterium]
MPKEDDDLLEIDESLDLYKFRSIEDKFDYLLRENDLLYESKIKFNITYKSSNNYYKINIIPSKEGFNSQEYFRKNFETGLGREKLEKFKRENNVGIIGY